jgi:hypothetical protein
MKPSRFRRISGTPARRAAGLLALMLAVGAVGACNYGIEGGGFPPHIRTIYIAPFENQTPQFDLDQRLYARMLEELPRRLGVRVAGENAADARVEGVIVGYDDVAQSFNPATAQTGPATAAHEIRVAVSVRLIDVRDHVIRWESQRLTGRGTYRPDTQSDEAGQILAIANIIEQIVDGAQSQW